MNITNEQWRKALDYIQVYYNDFVEEKTRYSTESLNEDHGCPPPIPELNKGWSQDKGTDTLWREKRILWCYPSNPKKGTYLKEDEQIPVACLGTTLWNIIHAFKSLGLEDEISNAKIEKLKSVSLQHPKGIAQAFVELGWANNVFTNPDEAQGGDVGVIGYGDELPHHWFVVAEEPHLEIDGHKALNTWAASPHAGGAGYDHWYKEKTRNNKNRYWILARPFEK